MGLGWDFLAVFVCLFVLGWVGVLWWVFCLFFVGLWLFFFNIGGAEVGLCLFVCLFFRNQSSQYLSQLRTKCQACL